MNVRAELNTIMQSDSKAIEDGTMYVDGLDFPYITAFRLKLVLRTKQQPH